MNPTCPAASDSEAKKFMHKVPQKIVVVGAGVIGTASAYYLSRSGCRVSIIDSGTFANGCSHANCGFVSPSHVLPLAMPGVVSKTLKAMFKKHSPFYIKPRIDPDLWKWLLAFWARCNHRDMIESGWGRHALLTSSRTLYEELITAESLACEWQTAGMLFAFQTKRELESYGELNRLQSETFGVAARQIGGDELLDFEPALKAGLAGAWYYESDAHLRPDRLMTSWRDVLLERGVTVHENCAFVKFGQAGTTARSILTTCGEMPADAFVFATGALTPKLNAHLGLNVPIQPGKGYSITMPRPRSCPRMPVIFPEKKVAVTPFQSGYRLGSTMEFAGYDTTLNRGRLEMLKVGAALFLQEPYCDPVEEEWFGWRPMTPDGRPFVDHAPHLSNVWIAAGHNMLGLSMGPATGKLIAELVTGQPPHIDPDPYRLRR